MRDFAWSSAAQLRLAFDFYSIANDRHNTTQMALLPGLAGRRVLHNEIFFCSGNIVFIRPMVYLNLALAKPFRWRRRSQRPLQRAAFPGVGFCRRSLEHAPE